MSPLRDRQTNYEKGKMGLLRSVHGQCPLTKCPVDTALKIEFLKWIKDEKIPGQEDNINSTQAASDHIGFTPLRAHLENKQRQINQLVKNEN